MLGTFIISWISNSLLFAMAPNIRQGVRLLLAPDGGFVEVTSEEAALLDISGIYALNSLNQRKGPP